MRELMRYKQELITLVVMSLLLLAVRWMGLHWFVDEAILDAAGNVLPGHEGQLPNQYDLRSETETVAWTVLRMVIYALCAWLGVRITMPEAYRWFKREFTFTSGGTSEQRSNFVLKLFAIFFFGLVVLHASGAPLTTRECVIASAEADLGVRELTGHNDGPRIEEYQAHVRAPKGSSWCVAFVSYHLSACGVKNPKSAWSPSYSLAMDRVWTPRKALRDPLPADVGTLYYPSLGRVGHGFFIKQRDGFRYVITLEGNTSGGGSRDGDGVYQRRRELSKVYAVTNYIPDAPATSTTDRATRHGGLPAAEEHHINRGSTRQRGRGVPATGHPHFTGSGQRQCPGGTASARTRPGTGDQPAWFGNGHAERDQRDRDSELRLGQHGDATAALGQVDQGEQLAHRSGEGEGGRDANARMVLVAAGPCDRGRTDRCAEVDPAHCSAVETLLNRAA